ncbi:hypothetical protein TRVL_01968 [Trypanosoma vivax]|nr:hypothetical protein TRVL_01968 [Trypanosoma vivax]
MLAKATPARPSKKRESALSGIFQTLAFAPVALSFSYSSTLTLIRRKRLPVARMGHLIAQQPLPILRQPPIFSSSHAVLSVNYVGAPFSLQAKARHWKPSPPSRYKKREE